MNQIPMRTGVRVNKEGDPRHDAVGTTIDRYEGGDLLVEFPDGTHRRFAETELKVLN
jgi:hypothetical protein